MQSSSHRRQQTYPESSGPADSTAMSTGVGTGTSSQPRASSGSGRSQRTTNPDKQISQIEKSVTHLLVATKQLLESLTQWSRGQAQEEEVSDVYVRLGYEFNLACRAFNSIGVDTSDLGNVPDLLRHILEDTLSQPASPQALDNYLPRIRDIIINLLHGLKRKQSKLRGRGSKEDLTSGKLEPGRQPSITSTTGSHETGLTQMLQDVPATTTSSRAESRQDGVRSPEGESYAPANTPAASTLGRGSLNRQSMRGDAPIVPSTSDSSMSSTTMQNLPVQAPPDEEQTSRPTSTANFPHPPPPPPKQHDALAALQRGGDLERRASRRFSAYQVSKHLGVSPNGVPVLPPHQHSPIPNRGRELRESMRAVQSRTSTQRTKSINKHPELSPSRSGTVRAPQRISEEQEEGFPQLDSKTTPTIQPPTQEGQDVDSPIAKTPDEYKLAYPPSGQTDSMMSATLNGPMSPVPESSNELPTPSNEKAPPPPDHQVSARPDPTSSPSTVERKPITRTPPQSQVIDADSSPPQIKELTLFLQYKTKIKKFVLPEGYDELTLARLQLAFIEKFAWNTQNDGLDLPEIYIQDPVSGVRHELEDLSDVKDRSVLVLNVEALDEVKKHFDDGIGGLQKTLDGFKGLIEGQGSMMQRFSDRQLETSKEMARMSAMPNARPPRTPILAQGEKSRVASPPPSGATMQEVQNLRRDIAILRQTYSSMTSDFTSTMGDVKAKAANVKQVAARATIPSYEGDAGRSHIITGKKQLSHDSELLIGRVDDLADVVEELRKDVVTRGVRPLPRQLENVNKELSTTAKELMKLKEFIKREKPLWTKIWEQELQTVMNEREDLTQREEIVGDLDGDLEDITGIFKLVEEAMKQQNLHAAQPSALRSTSRGLAFESEVNPLEAKEGVLGEVRGLKFSHEERVEAIERAERARQRELQTRKGGEFQQEVEDFVGEGKLRKTGGADEVERRRKLADEKARRDNWETQERRKLELAQKRAEQARLAAEAAANTETNGDEQPGSNDTSQEGDAAFQDAAEHKDASTDQLPPVLPAKNNVDSQVHDGPPQLPEMAIGDDEHKQGYDVDKGKESKIAASPASTKGNRASQSWWKPAVFGSGR